MIKSLKGVNGTIELYQNKIVIKREGMLAKMTQGMFTGNKEIMIESISAIEFKEATLWTNGFIQFTIPGEGNTNSSLKDKVENENTVMFRRSFSDNSVTEEWKELKNGIQKMIDVSKTQNKSTTVNELSSADELEKFAKLKEQGVISEEEFQIKKKELLGL